MEVSDEEKLSAEKAKAAELNDRYLRLSAEFDNYKKAPKSVTEGLMEKSGLSTVAA